MTKSVLLLSLVLALAITACFVAAIVSRPNVVQSPPIVPSNCHRFDFSVPPESEWKTTKEFFADPKKGLPR
jgi:hypothetical protein